MVYNKKVALLVTGVLFILLPLTTLAQFAGLKLKDKRLLLQLGSSFYNVLKQNAVSLDSSLPLVNGYYKIGISAVIADGFEDDFNPVQLRWIDIDDPAIAKKQLSGLKGIEHTKLLMLIGAYYSFQPENNKQVMDSALVYLSKAKNESIAAHSEKWLDHTLILLGKYEFNQNNFDKGDVLFKSVINSTQKSGNLAIEAKAYNYYGTYCPFTGATIMPRIMSLDKATNLYQQLHDVHGAIITSLYRAYLSFAIKDMKAANKAAILSLQLQKACSFPFTHNTTDLLSLIGSETGDNAAYLSYAQQTVKSAESTNDKFALSFFYERLGTAMDRKDFTREEVVLIDKKAMDLALQPGNYLRDFAALTQRSFDLLAQKKANEALALINLYARKYPPTDLIEQEVVTTDYGDCYFVLHNYRLTEAYYLKALALEQQYDKTGFFADRNIYSSLGTFYTQTGQYKIAKYFYTLYLSRSSPAFHDILKMQTIDLDLAKIDSANGDYLAMMRHYQQYMVVHDSLYKYAQLKQLESERVKYETIEKEQSIKLLQSQDKADRTHLQQIGLQRNIILGGTAMLLIISGLTYSRYRIKKRSNLLLQERQNDLQNLVSEKNNLLSDKDQLLSEKDLLLKEVHHRVKNNLHIVMSLLESQSSYLSNSAAITAILESQNRVRAIALIHQKLYSSGNVVQVDMQSYIPELVTYLVESFNTTKQNIFIKHTIDNIKLDVSQAIPVGIILNEAITNAIKYAFAEREGEINIIMQQQESNRVSLEIRDNGTGFPPNFDPQNVNSLGMTLMKGLSVQLEGGFKIESQSGVKISIDFVVDNSLHLNRYEMVDDQS